MRALAEVVVPTVPEADIAVDLDGVVRFVDEIYGHMPRLLQLAFPVGLLLLEYGTWIWGGTLRRFSRLDRAHRDRYVRSWIASRMLLRRDLIKGVKGLCLFAFYSDRRVADYLDYHPERHAELVAVDRLRRYGHELR